jgi:hypothetical protein
VVPRCSDILAELIALKSESVGKPHYINAIDDIYQKLLDCMIENGLTETHFIDENFVHIICEVAMNAMKTCLRLMTKLPCMHGQQPETP